MAVILEGAARKWLLPNSLQAIPYFAKDVLAVIFVLNNQLRDGPNHWSSKLGGYAFGIGIVLLPSFILGLTVIPVGAFLVFKNAVLWPLLAITLGRRLTPAVVERLWPALLACSVGMAVLSVAQYYSGPASILNRYAWNEAETAAKLNGIATAADFVRATGTFSYLAGLGTFSLVIFCIFLGRCVTQTGTRDTLISALGLAASVVCGLTTGNRAVEVIMFAISAITLVVAPKKRAVRLGFGMFCAGLVFLALWNTSLSKGVASRWADTNAADFRGRATGSATDQPWIEIIASNPFGQGLGLYSGFSSYSGVRDEQDIAYNEGGAAKGLAESGLLGVIANLLTFAIAGKAILMIVKRSSPATQTRLVPTLAGLLLAIYGGLWYDHNATGMWWWAAAICFGEGLTFARTKTRKPLSREAARVVTRVQPMQSLERS